jgi:antitoxin component YwqK of YwqJK toxin-antitoxin module
VLYTTECRCDDSGNLVEERYLKGEEFLGRNEYTYDSGGRILSETHFDNQDACSGSYRFKYDEKGRCTARAWHNLAGKLMTTFSYTLDDKGNRVRAELVKDGKIENVQEFTYDARGNLLEERWKDEKGTLLRTIPHRAAD